MSPLSSTTLTSSARSICVAWWSSTSATTRWRRLPFRTGRRRDICFSMRTVACAEEALNRSPDSSRWVLPAFMLFRHACCHRWEAKRSSRLSRLIWSWPRKANASWRFAPMSMSGKTWAARRALLFQGLKQRALALHARRAILRKPQDTVEHRLRVQVRFSDDIGFKSAGQPLVIPVRRQRIFIHQPGNIAQRPHAPRSGADEHQIVARLRWQNGIPIGFRLTVEQFLADRGEDLHVDSSLLEPRKHVHQIHGGAGSLRHDVTVPRLVRREIADHVHPFCGCSHVGIGKLAAVGNLEIRSCHFDDDDSDLLFARGNFGCGEVSRSDVVVIPKTQVDDLPAWKQFPHLRRKNAEVRARIRSGFRT